MKLLLPLVLLLCGCNELIKPYKVESSIEIYVQIFRDEASFRGFDYSLSNNLIIKFGDSNKMIGIAAATKTRKPRVIRILINPSQWARHNSREREIIIMHELGHGRLNRDHDWKIDCNGNPTTLMIVEFPADQQINYIDYREEMLNELFGIEPVLEECL